MRGSGHRVAKPMGLCILAFRRSQFREHSGNSGCLMRRDLCRESSQQPVGYRAHPCVCVTQDAANGEHFSLRLRQRASHIHSNNQKPRPTKHALSAVSKTCSFRIECSGRTSGLQGGVGWSFRWLVAVCMFLSVSF